MSAKLAMSANISPVGAEAILFVLGLCVLSIISCSSSDTTPLVKTILRVTPVVTLASLAPMLSQSQAASKTYSRTIGLGMLFSAAADACISFYLIGSVVSYIIAHYCFIMALSSRGATLRPLRFTHITLLIAVAAFLFQFLQVNIESAPLTLLVAAAGFMVYYSCHSASGMYAAVGAVVLTISNIIFALSLYYPEFPLSYPFDQISILTTYYMGHCLFTLSVMYPPTHHVTFAKQ